LRIRDIPISSKTSFVTALPKDEGTIHSFDNIRPISVSPILGRLINKLKATRLGTALTTHTILHSESQYVFLPGKNIHDPISAIMQCYERSSSALDNSPDRACYAIFYDISKAYDTLCWSSIFRALRRIGAPPALIDYVRNSLHGTRLAMRTNIRGRLTPTVTISKAVKQGCPLAPLLFAIVMDELHTQYARIGGYTLEDGTVVASRGYCDDTAIYIVANDLITLQRLHDVTYTFFTKHNLILSTKKTNMTGRHADGSPLRTPSPGLIAPNP
jgi:hypothetical protein